MAQAPGSSHTAPIDGHFTVDINQPLPDAGGGIPAYAAIDRRAPGAIPLMALRASRHAPVRARALNTSTFDIDGMAIPLAHGHGPPLDGEDAYYIVCLGPSGPPLSVDLRPWPESQLIDRVMRPISQVLEGLHARGLTHRAIRPNNVFHTAPAKPVMLGAAWAAPPAMHQPPVFETAYSALMHPAARGDGRIADDVYALGVLLVTLAIGRVPMAGLDPMGIIHRKLDLGDFAAVTEGERLPPALTDIVRGMLAEDPDHRPQPSLLRDPVGARGRRVATRPLARAQTPLRIGAISAWNTRTLAMAMAVEPADAASALQSGALMLWLRRGLGDSTLAVRLEDMLRQHAQDVSPDREIANAMLLMRAITAADILMPMCWRGLAVNPEGLGPTLTIRSGTDPDLSRKLQQILASEAASAWANMREERTPPSPYRTEARQRRLLLQLKGPAGGLTRLLYVLNPLLPCASPLFAGRWIILAAELAGALDAVAASTPEAELLDAHVVAFLASRSERLFEQEVKDVAGDLDPAQKALSTLRLLAGLQTRYHEEPLRGLTRWVAARAEPLVRRWKNRARRAAVEARLKELAPAGMLPPILALLEDPPGHTADTEGLKNATDMLARLDAELHAIAAGGPMRAAIAARLGQEIAAGAGLIAVAATLILAALG